MQWDGKEPPESSVCTGCHVHVAVNNVSVREAHSSLMMSEPPWVEVSSNIKTKTLFVCQAGDMDKSFSGVKWTSVRIKHRQLTFGNCPCTKDKLAELVWPCNCAVMSYGRLWCFTGNFYLNVSLLGSLAFTNLHFIETQKFNLNSSIGTTNDTEHRGQWLTMQSNKKVI